MNRELGTRGAYCMSDDTRIMSSFRALFRAFSYLTVPHVYCIKQGFVSVLRSRLIIMVDLHVVYILYMKKVGTEFTERSSQCR